MPGRCVNAISGGIRMSRSGNLSRAPRRLTRLGRCRGEGFPQDQPERRHRAGRPRFPAADAPAEGSPTGTRRAQAMLLARSFRSREASVETSMCSFVDGTHTRSRMARPECDEHPDKLALVVTRELHDHAERSLRRGSLPEGQIDLRAARKARSISTLGLARAGVSQRQAFELKTLAGTTGNLERASGEPSRGLVPDTLIEPDGQATTAGGNRQPSAFAVGRCQLVRERREVLATGWRGPEPCVDGVPRFGRRDLQQLRRQTIHALCDSLGLLRTQRPDR